MGVYIKGMKMPERCWDCYFCYDCFYCMAVDVQFSDREDFEPSERRLSDCPLVPVPPHGRLIDADAMIHDIEKAFVSSWYTKKRNADMVKFLSLEDAIIPAEEDET